jgi:uncharacterized protein (TIGR02145 family)
MKNILSAVVLLLAFVRTSGQEKFTDTRDGNVYKIITVQGVTWMAENLKYKPDTGARPFDNNHENLHCYGALYEWRIAVNACPSGWHLPTGQEFRALANYFDRNESWKKLESDPASFGIQLGGMQDQEGTFAEMDESAYYWTSTEYDKSNAEYFSYLLINQMPVIDISRSADIAEIPGTEKSNLYSVRCVRN